jgi:phosphinothricin acetyltransferase
MSEATGLEEQIDFRIEPLSSRDDETAIVDLFNYYIENSFAAYPEQKITYELFDHLRSMAEGYPVIVAKDRSGRLLGFGMLRPHNPMPAFSETAEITYFISQQYIKKGIGTALLQTLLDRAREMNITSILANVSSLNEPSIAFHKKMGFQECGRFVKIGKKWGKVFDVVWMQKMLRS